MMIKRLKVLNLNTCQQNQSLAALKKGVYIYIYIHKRLCIYIYIYGWVELTPSYTTQYFLIGCKF